MSGHDAEDELLKASSEVTQSDAMLRGDLLLVPLRTKAEVEAKVDLAEAFVLRVPAKCTAGVIRFVFSQLSESYQ